MSATVLRLSFQLPRLTFRTKTPTRLEGPERLASRRETLGDLVSSDGCSSEWGVMALMTLYPRDF